MLFHRFPWNAEPFGQYGSIKVSKVHGVLQVSSVVGFVQRWMLPHKGTSAQSRTKEQGGGRFSVISTIGTIFKDSSAKLGEGHTQYVIILFCESKVFVEIIDGNGQVGH